MRSTISIASVVFSLVTVTAAQSWKDPSPHREQMISVDDNVQLEVLDWGGSGRPMVLVTGLGNTAHVFDDFAPRLASLGHVYGITRRGYGKSSAPADGYGAERLGMDVLRVLDALKLERPIMVAHSIGGQELSFLGSRHPDRVAGLIYLDAAYDYAFWLDPSPLAEKPPGPMRPPAGDGSELKSVEAFRARSMQVRGFVAPEAELRQQFEVHADGSIGPPRTPPHVGKAINSGSGRTYTFVKPPSLAIFASPHHPGPFAEQDPAALAAFLRFDEMLVERQAQSIEKALPNVRVVRLPRANHYVFLSHPEDVLREMRVFIEALK
ncbi:MAG TPA: alpha/beta hydrolase [Vicinamibacterales bacterium]|nr:alpha/beta hydrolase [Vicinamibacterales bacterium]